MPRFRSTADYYLCGPDAFMRSLSAGITARGTAPEHVAMELFGAAAVDRTTGTRGLAAGASPARPHPRDRSCGHVQSQRPHGPVG